MKTKALKALTLLTALLALFSGFLLLQEKISGQAYKSA